jgi:hypothetical protein
MSVLMHCDWSECDVAVERGHLDWITVQEGQGQYPWHFCCWDHMVDGVHERQPRSART